LSTFRQLITRIALAAARRAGIRVARVVVRPLEGSPQPAAPDAIRCRLVKEAELRLWSFDPALQLNEAQLRSAFERGDVCVGAFDRWRLVGYEWLGFRATPHAAGLWVQFRPSDCYMYKTFVHPAYRGLGIAGLLNAAGNEIAARHQRERVICFIDLKNSASWQAAKRSGSFTAGYVGYIACFGRAIAFRTAGASRQGFRFSALS